MLVFFKTRCSVHHPLEVLLQNKNMGTFLKHPVSTGRYESKVCPLGKCVAWLFATWLILRQLLSQKKAVMWSKRLWVVLMLGAGLMNLNVLIYLLPAFIIDCYCT
jgi:hypothetical protein